MVFFYYIMYISIIITYCDVPSNVNLRSVFPWLCVRCSVPKNVNLRSLFPWLRVLAVFITNENALTDIVVTSNSDGCYHFYGYLAVSKIPDHC
jgi:hypothetical protein